MHFSGYVFALMAVFFWSYNNIIAQQYASALTPVQFAFGRWFVAALILLPFTIRDLWQNRHYFVKHFLWLFGLGISGIVLDNTLIYLAGHTVPATNMGILSITGPIFLVLLSFIFLKTPISFLQIIGMIIAIVGVLVVITNNHLSDLFHISLAIGDFWVIINALCFAIYSFLQFRKPTIISQITLLSATVWAGLIILTPAFFLTTPFTTIHHFTTTDYSLFIYLGIFNSVLAYLTWNSALQRIGAIKTGIIYYLLPVFTLIESVLVLKEPIYSSQIIGGLCVMSGIILVNLKKQTSTRQTKQTPFKQSVKLNDPTNDD